MKKQIRIHVQRFSWDKRVYNIDELKQLLNYDKLPPASTLNEIDADLNVWFACSGYDGRTGLYLKEWDGKKGNVKDLL